MYEYRSIDIGGGDYISSDWSLNNKVKWINLTLHPEKK